MNKLKSSPFVFVVSLVAFCGWLIFTIFFGYRYPNIVWWSFVVLFAAIVVVYVTPSTKQAVILLLGMIALAIVGEIVHNLIPTNWNELLKFAIQCVVLYPIYMPLFGYFVKIFINNNPKK